MDKVAKKIGNLNQTADGMIIWRDIVQAHFPSSEQNWVLQLSKEDKDRIYSLGNKLGIYTTGLHRKFFVVRDIYKYLSKVRYRLDALPEQSWWLDVILDSNLNLLRQFTINKPTLAKIIANLLSIALHKPIQDISRADTIKDLANNNLKSTHLDKEAEEMKNTLKSLISNLTTKLPKMEEIGNIVSWSFGDNRIHPVKFPRNILNKVISLGQGVAGYYQSIEKVQNKTDIPHYSDYVFSEEVLLLQHIAEGFINLDRRSKINIDLYIDTSGSMIDTFYYDNSYTISKIMLAKGVILQLRKYNVKFRKIYRFSADLDEIKLKDINLLNPDGGTSIAKVLENIAKQQSNAIIISDLEDTIDTGMAKLLEKVRSKICVIQIGKKKVYEEWKKHTGIAYFIEVPSS